MSQNIYRIRRSFFVLCIVITIAGFSLASDFQHSQEIERHNEKISEKIASSHQAASQALEVLPVKGRAPKTGYKRSEFGNGWQKSGSCTTRELILARDLEQTEIRDCKVYSGTLNDPYTGKRIAFIRGPESSDDIQIDHVVALSDAWQKGAQNLSASARESLANDPLELIAVDGEANQKKGDGDAATWLPSNKDFRCRYVARQIAVKQKYQLWITSAEKEAMKNILTTCPTQPLPVQKN